MYSHAPIMIKSSPYQENETYQSVPTTTRTNRLVIKIKYSDMIHNLCRTLKMLSSLKTRYISSLKTRLTENYFDNEVDNKTSLTERYFELSRPHGSPAYRHAARKRGHGWTSWLGVLAVLAVMPRVQCEYGHHGSVCWRCWR